MNKKLTISATDEKVPFPAAVRGSKTPVLKLSSIEFAKRVFLFNSILPNYETCLD